MAKYCFILFIFFTVNLSAQNNYKQQVAEKVLNELANAYGSSKSAPIIKILPKTAPKIIAHYNPSPIASIELDEALYDICSTFNSDSLNALAVIISHELSHYYNDHNWCSDFAFALSKTNITFAKKLNTVSKESKIEKETIADRHGLFYACVAGYNPFKIYSKLIDKIYKHYQLPDNTIGYPSRQERKQIADNAEAKASELYTFFKVGLNALNENKWDTAIAAFTKANAYIPFPENYNNLGIAKARKALTLKVKTSEEINYPNRFLYPLEVENKSRLSQDDTRAIDDEKQEQMLALLKDAQKDLQEAIRLNNKFTKAHINLACVFDLLDNPAAAIGKIKELPIEQQKTTAAQKILAIAYYHNEQEQKAMEIWKVLKM
jgi:hypothetical protein